MNITKLQSSNDYNTANKLVDTHGNNAETVALKALNISMQQGDVKKAGNWLTVVQDINNLQKRSKHHLH